MEKMLDSWYVDKTVPHPPRATKTINTCAIFKLFPRKTCDIMAEQKIPQLGLGLDFCAPC